MHTVAMRRVDLLAAVGLLLAACSSGVVTGHGSQAGGAASNGGSAPSHASSAVAGTVEFTVTGHANRVTGVLTVDGRTRSLGVLHLPYTLRLPKTGRHYDLKVTFTAGGEVECTASQSSPGGQSGGGAGAGGAGGSGPETLDCNPDG